MKKLILFTLIIFTTFCFSNKSMAQFVYKPGPSAIVYKTKKDYSQNVPVILSADKSKIVTYYGKGDMTFRGEIGFPTVLDKGYLLDNIGINENIAYTSLKIEDYKKSDKNYTADELYSLIIDKKPLKEMYDCGLRNNFQNEVVDLNLIIKNKELKKAKKLK